MNIDQILANIFDKICNQTLARATALVFVIIASELCKRVATARDLLPQNTDVLLDLR